MRGDADFAQLGDRLLRRFRFKFSRRLDEGNVGDMQKNRVVVAHREGELADGFQKRKTFNVAGGAADLGDDHIRFGVVSE